MPSVDFDALTNNSLTIAFISLTGAARSQRYRDRRRVTDHGVTDYGSLSDSDLGLLNASATNAVAKTSSNGSSPPISLSESWRSDCRRSPMLVL
jgi:hypothetical protein